MLTCNSSRNSYQVFEIGCDILATLSPKQHFADAVAEQGALWRLLWVLERPDAQDHPDSDSTHSDQTEMLRKQRGWMLLEALSSSSSVAQKIVESTAWLELLGILVGYSGFTKVWIARAGAAKTLSRLLWDPKTGPVVGKLFSWLPLLSVRTTIHLSLVCSCTRSSIAAEILACNTQCRFERGRGRQNVEPVRR